MCLYTLTTPRLALAIGPFFSSFGSSSFSLATTTSATWRFETSAACVSANAVANCELTRPDCPERSAPVLFRLVVVFSAQEHRAVDEYVGASANDPRYAISMARPPMTTTRQ